MSKRSVRSYAAYPFHRSSAFLVIPGLLILWELFYFLDWIDPLRFSHPIGIFKTLGDWYFLRGFLFMLAQWTFAFLLGGAIGITVGAILVHNTWLTRAAARFLRVGLWIPFLSLWALPIGYPQEDYLLVNVFFVWVLSIAAVSLFSCYYYLVVKSNFRWRWGQILSEVAKASILQGLFISFISQIFLPSYGWAWFTPSVDVRYSTAIVLIVFLFLINRLFQSSFQDAAELRSTLIKKEVAHRDWMSLLGASVLAVGCLAVWQLLNSIGFHSIISSPLEILKALYSLFVAGIDLPNGHERIWGHLGVSILEVFAGLIVVGGIALLVSKSSATNADFRTWAHAILPLTYIVPIVFSVFWILWIGTLGKFGSPLHTVLCIALISFYPIVQVLWGLRDT